MHLHFSINFGGNKIALSLVAVSFCPSLRWGDPSDQIMLGSRADRFAYLDSTFSRIFLIFLLIFTYCSACIFLFPLYFVLSLCCSTISMYLSSVRIFSCPACPFSGTLNCQPHLPLCVHLSLEVQTRELDGELFHFVSELVRFITRRRGGIIWLIYWKYDDFYFPLLLCASGHGKSPVSTESDKTT